MNHKLLEKLTKAVSEVYLNALCDTKSDFIDGETPVDFAFENKLDDELFCSVVTVAPVVVSTVMFSGLSDKNSDEIVFKSLSMFHLHKLYNLVKKNSEMSKVIDELKKSGVDVDSVLERVKREEECAKDGVESAIIDYPSEPKKAMATLDGDVKNDESKDS